MADSHRMTRTSNLPRLAAACGLLLATFLAGCNSTEVERRDWSGYRGPGAQYFQVPELADIDNLTDPGEPTNRSLRAVNHWLLIYVIDPLAQGYRWLVPDPVRDSIYKLGHNLAYPKRLVNNLLQARFAGAGRETMRFLINTTVGIIGLFDPATSWFEIEESEADFGQTLATWGFDGSVYVVAPILDMGSDRDTPAALVDLVLDPASYLPGANLLFRVNHTGDELEKYKRLYRTHYDPYAFIRYLYQLNRSSQYLTFEYQPDAEVSSETQTLKAVYLSFQDEDFPSECEDGEVYLKDTDSSLPFTYRMQEQPAPLMFILPGLAGHRESESALGLAEMAWRNGFSAVTISSAMNWEFMQTASTAYVPGYGPVDAHDTHVALDAIYRQLQQEYPGRITATSLLGLSLGAYHTLLIAAAAEVPGTNLLKFDRYVPINPPVSLFRSVEALDDCYHAYVNWPEQERFQKINETIMKVLKLAGGSLQPTVEIPLSEIEARFIIGINYRADLMFTIHCSQIRHNLGILKTDMSVSSRGPAYDEIFDYSYMEYFYGFVLPYYMKERKVVTSAEQMIERTDLRYIESQLRANDRVRLFTNINDFLLSPEDIAWLKDVFGDERSKFFPEGGHLGNLYKPDVQDQIMQSLRDLTHRR